MSCVHQGILDAVLSMLLNDSQLLRICNSLTMEDVRSLAFNLGVSNTTLDAIGVDSIPMNKFYSLRICREKNKTCKDFVKAMEAAEINRHIMCEVRSAFMGQTLVFLCFKMTGVLSIESTISLMLKNIIL